MYLFPDQLNCRLVGGFLPHEEECKRYNQPCIDFFCTLWPLTSEGGTATAASNRDDSLRVGHSSKVLIPAHLSAPSLTDPSLLLVKGVRAHAHLCNRQCYDHDPVLCNFLLARASAGCAALPAGVSDAHQVGTDGICAHLSALRCSPPVSLGHPAFCPCNQDCPCNHSHCARLLVGIAPQRSTQGPCHAV